MLHNIKFFKKRKIWFQYCTTTILFRNVDHV